MILAADPDLVSLLAITLALLVGLFCGVLLLHGFVGGFVGLMQSSDGGAAYAPRVAADSIAGWTSPAAVALDASLHVCIGAVLSGGLFGDHGSTVWETKILSATGAGCDPFQHFHNRFPYARGNGAICVAGYRAVGIASTPWLLVALLAAQIALVCLAGPKGR